MVELKNGSLLINPDKVESLEQLKNGTYKVTMQSGANHVISGEDAGILSEKIAPNLLNQLISKVDDYFDKIKAFLEQQSEEFHKPVKPIFEGSGDPLSTDLPTDNEPVNK